MAEWSACRTRNLAVPGSASPTLTSTTLLLGSLEFRFSATFASGQFELFVSVVCSALQVLVL